MGDYIRGKKAYTKWDAESENIDIEYRPDAQKKQTQDGWLSGTKGKVIKVLLVLLVFCLGLIMGFFVRRGVREVKHHNVVNHDDSVDAYSFSAVVQHRLLEMIKKENIKKFLQNYTSDAHIAGKPSNKVYVQQLHDLWQSWGLENVHIEKFEVLLSYPSSTTPNKVRLISRIDNAPKQIASESGDDELHSDFRPYLAYAPNGTAEGKLVYANYGRREDFEYLQKENVNVSGCVVIMRLGKIHKANKIKFAEEFGAVGALLYPDPSDYVKGMPIYPDGLGLPGSGVIRGNLNLAPGDPITPLQAATETAHRISQKKWKMRWSLPSIPVQPISYNNAIRFMTGMAGPPASANWTGGLNITYSLGPGHAAPNDYVVNISVFNELKKVEIFNLLGVIQGKFEPDRYIILGNHHDSWTNGTGDPGTGLAAFLEMVRAFAELKQDGWQPGRSLVFACWDAEEFGMVGSTEWLQLHQKELAARAVAYINTDAGIEGASALRALGSPLLLQALTTSAKLVSFKQHAYDTVIHHWLTTGLTPDLDIQSLDILPGGSDYVSFMNMNGISSLHLQFVGSDDDNSVYRLFHSAFDNYDAFVEFIDPKFELSLTLAHLLATLALQLSDNMKLPINTEDYGDAVLNEYRNFKQTYSARLAAINVSLSSLSIAVDAFHDACFQFHNNFSAMSDSDVFVSFHEYNDRAMELERSLLEVPWDSYRYPYRHAIFGPHPYNLNEGVAFPQLVTAILRYESEGDIEVAERIHFELSQVIASLYSAVGVLTTNILNYHDQSDPTL